MRDYVVVVFSSDLGYKKPEPRIFRHALSRLSVYPGSALFIGDSYRNDIGGPALYRHAVHASQGCMAPALRCLGSGNRQK
ncbi:HAD family hydrolase [Methanofollis fontis]|uniref:HAD family hydrolase n=1 Tax=Methanofollis fontis TaxID=2052832 RepID=UPI001F2DF9BC|nr:HAD family hydrolase [Methanofollis fontis]